MYNIVQVVMQLKQVVCQQSKIQYILSLNVQLSARFLNYLKDYSTYLENRLFKHFFFIFIYIIDIKQEQLFVLIFR